MCLMSCASLGLPLEVFYSVEFSLHDGEHILSLCAYFWLIVCCFFECIYPCKHCDRILTNELPVLNCESIH